MAISLAKGQPIVLAKQDSITQIVAGLQWDARRTDGDKFDADISAFLLGEDGNVIGGQLENVVFYNNLRSADGAIIHSGDNRTGDGDGYDETITIDLNKVRPDVKRIVLTTSVHNIAPANLNFGQITNASIDVNVTGGEQYKYDLTEDHSSHRSVVLVEVYRHQDSWRVKALDEGYTNGLEQALQAYGVTA